MKTHGRVLTGFGFFGRKSREVALAAVMVGCAIVIHGVLVVMPSNGNATLADGSNGKDIVLRLGQHAEPVIADPLSQELLRMIERHETSIALVTETAAAPQQNSTDAEAAKSSTPSQPAVPAPAPARPAVAGRTAVAGVAAPASTNANIDKPTISALAAADDSEPVALAVSALPANESGALPDLAPPPLAISATAR
jgi:hypothetical protein